jgi:hypothetical protein
VKIISDNFSDGYAKYYSPSDPVTKIYKLVIIRDVHETCQRILAQTGNMQSLQWQLFTQLCQDLLQGLEIWETNTSRTILLSPNLFNDLQTEAIDCWVTVRTNLKLMPSDYGWKLRLKRGDIKKRKEGDLADVAWRRKRNIRVLTDMPRPPAEGNVWSVWKRLESSHYTGDRMTVTPLADVHGNGKKIFFHNATTLMWVNSPNG